jgi:hypothetical protein
MGRKKKVREKVQKSGSVEGLYGEAQVVAVR